MASLLIFSEKVNSNNSLLDSQFVTYKKQTFARNKDIKSWCCFLHLNMACSVINKH